MTPGNFLRDLRHAARLLVREPGYTLAFTITLGLGIGANTAIFSVINGVLLRPLPYPEADRIVRLQQPAHQRGLDSIDFSFVEVADYRAQSRALEEIVEYGDWTFNVLDRGDPHRAVAGLVTANFFEVLGMRPALGRLLEPADRDRDAPPVAVLSYDYWQTTFGGDLGVIGQSLNLTTKSATIVGVLAPGAHYATERPLDFYANYASNDHYSGASMQDQRNHRMTEVFARMAPGVVLEAARAELDGISQRLHAEYPDNYPAGWGLGMAVTPWAEELTRRARPTLLILFATAAFVLLIACANVANLTLTRLVRRDRELAVRAALGAGTAGLRGLLFAENLVLALSGAGLGLVVAYASLDMLITYTSRFTSRTGEITVDPGVLGFTIVVAVGAALIFALAPRVGGERGAQAALASGGGHATASKGRRQAQRLLVVGQLALSFMLLVGAGLLARTLVNLYGVDPGFDLDNVLSMEAPKFGPSTPEEGRQFADQLVDAVASHPGVDNVALAGSAPLGGGSTFNMRFRADGQADDADVPFLPTAADGVSAGYFAAVGTSVLRGREFTRQDIADGAQVALLSESMARHYFPDGDAVGRQIAYSFGGSWGDDFTVVGIVADTRATGLQNRETHGFYVPEGIFGAPDTVLVRTSAGAAPVAPYVVETIRQLDPERPVEHINTLAELRAESIAPQRLNAVLFGSFAGLALAIAAVGIAGVLAFQVTQRTRELGIRMALGADRGAVLGMVLRDGGLMAIAGLTLGAIGASLVSRFLSSLLFEVESFDPVSYAVAAAVLLGVAMLAAYLPARRATRLDPMVSLRSE